MSAPIKPIINQVSYSQGPEGCTVFFQLVCENVPVGSFVRFFSDDPGPQPLINLTRTKVSNNSFTTGLQTKVPPDFMCAITWCLTVFEPLPEHARVSFRAVFIAGKDHPEYASARAAKLCFPDGLPAGIKADSRVLIQDLEALEHQPA